MSHSVPVAIVEEVSGHVVARADLEPNRLPHVHARLRIDGRAWVVVRVGAAATPADAVELVVRELTDLTLPALQFRLPTISGDLPKISRAERAGSVLDLSEDAWRQVELVARSQLPAVEACLGAVRQIRTHGRLEPSGWSRCHVRRELPLPIAPWTLPRRVVVEAFEDPIEYEGLSYPGLAALAAGGFALTTRSGLELYGIATHGGVTTLAVLGWGDHQRAADVTALAALAEEHELDLVDWPQARRLPPAQFATYFAARAGARE